LVKRLRLCLAPRSNTVVRGRDLERRGMLPWNQECQGKQESEVVRICVFEHAQNAVSVAPRSKFAGF